MPSQQDLCLLQDVKAWLYGDPTGNKWPTNADVQLASYITSASRMVLTTLQRPNLVAHNVDEIRSGRGSDRLMLRQYPVLGDLTILSVNGVIIPKRPPLGSTTTLVSVSGGGRGWVIDNPWDGYSPGSPAVVCNSGNGFGWGSASIEIKYVAGYAILSEPATIPLIAPYTIQPLESNGRFAADISIIHASDLTPFTTVNSIGVLATGKYLPPQPPTAPVLDASWVPKYTFDASDAGVAVYVSYSYTPADLQHAVAKLVGEWWRYKDRIGEKSKALPQGGGTASFDLSAMPLDVMMVVNSYKRTSPIY